MDALTTSPHPRLSRAEYWILETAVQFGVPLCYLGANKVSIEAQFNKPGHGLDNSELASCLHNLFSVGAIEARRRDDELAFMPTREQIVAALDSKPPTRGRTASEYDFLYRLSPTGCSIWEAFAAPEWERFLLEDFDYEGYVGTLTCVTRSRIERYLDYLVLHSDHYAIQRDTIKIVECGEWDATYWKRLHEGFRASFAWSKPSLRPSSLLERLASSGACQFRDRWYRWR